MNINNINEGEVGGSLITESPPILMTSRFSDETLLQNKKYREKTKKKCVYCSPSRITQNIKENSMLFILELNISKNRIEAIGLIQNIPKYGISVYSNGNYNRYVYIGKYRISRCEMTIEEEEIMKFFDIICFKGKFHMKRGSGITCFPLRILNICNTIFNLILFIKQMFNKRVK